MPKKTPTKTPVRDKLWELAVWSKHGRKERERQQLLAKRKKEQDI